ncbi:hypothetical protein UlMin_015393 [Ulmus minor]
MEGLEEFVGSSTDHHHQQTVAKGKRTKRQRLVSSTGFYGLGAATTTTTTTSSSSSACGSARVGDEYASFSSPTATTSGAAYESTEEEEDMANCLILLAQGDHQAPKQVSSGANLGKSGFFVYECKTCNRSFSSFQALGGHRASHKKPKQAPSEEKREIQHQIEEKQVLVFEKSESLPSSLPIQITSNNHKVSFQGNKANKVHECSICGSEFTSGQALGGHMRRHRAAASNADSTKIKPAPRNVLALDLNLPAPEEDLRSDQSKFQFVPTQQALVFSAQALVDCHY